MGSNFMSMWKWWMKVHAGFVVAEIRGQGVRHAEEEQQKHYGTQVRDEDQWKGLAMDT